MSDLIERIAIAISPLVRCADVNFPHGLDWDGEDEAQSLTLEERDERRKIVAAVFAELHAAGREIVPKEPTEDMDNVGWLSYESDGDPSRIYRAMLAAAPEVTE